jgi:hypothetical protein
MSRAYVLTLSCPGRIRHRGRGRGVFGRAAGNILASAQFDGRLSDRFFMRVEFETAAGEELLAQEFTAVADRFGMPGASPTSSRRCSPARVRFHIERPVLLKQPHDSSKPCGTHPSINLNRISKFRGVSVKLRFGLQFY